MKTDEPISVTVEEYLETIYNMSTENEIVIGARLAERFGVAPPSVTEMLKRMVRDGYIEMNSKRQVTLTEHGYEVAEGVVRRHRLTERLLVDLLGMQWHEVHEEACRLEHFISGAVEARVIANLNNPLTCPHGNPIPGYVLNARTYLQDKHAVRLSTLSAGSEATILCISEVVEDETALICYMHEKGLMPDIRIKVVIPAGGNAPEIGEGVKLRVGERDVMISGVASSKVWVTVL